MENTEEKYKKMYADLKEKGIFPEENKQKIEIIENNNLFSNIKKAKHTADNLRKQLNINKKTKTDPKQKKLINLKIETQSINTKFSEAIDIMKFAEKHNIKITVTMN
jgi:hypothetical protein